MTTIYHIRYWLELIALPVFAYLVFHMTGHGVTEIFMGEHDHIHEHGHAEGLIDILNFENIAGILLLALFVWLWHRPFLKKWVPCSHTHCEGEKDTSPIPHFVAIIALCLHFFPEAAVREVLLENLAEKTAFVGAIGFIAHFFVDIIVTFLIASYWQKKSSQFFTVIFIAAMWIISFKLGSEFFHNIPESIQGLIFIIGGFFLAMFVHMPHKPVSACGHEH